MQIPEYTLGHHGDMEWHALLFLFSSPVPGPGNELTIYLHIKKGIYWAPPMF